MKRLAMLSVPFSLALALNCASPGRAAQFRVPTDSAAERLDRGVATDASFPPVADAVYQTNSDVTTITIPAGSCSAVYASPIQVGDFIVWANHDGMSGMSNECTASPYKDALLGYNVRDGILYLLGRNGSSEATLLYQPDIGRVFQNIVFGGTVSVLDATTFAKVAGLPTGFRVTSDASGVYLNGLYYFGTINPPSSFCQQPVNENCGGVFAMDINGNIMNSLNVQDHLRSWIGAGLTTNGQSIYVGGSPHWLGNIEPPGYYGCSVVKLDPQLNILASFDPGDAGCHHTGAQQNDEDAVAGEVVIAADGSMWVVFAHAVDSRNMFSMYHLDADLQQMCVFELAGGPLTMMGYYQSPTIDKDGNVYVNVSPTGVGPNSTGQLWKVTPGCQGTKLADLIRGGTSMPVLADDRYILTIAGGQLHIRDSSGNVVKTYALASQAMVVASPMIAGGVIYVVDTTGALTVIRNSGLQGYGTAAWPLSARQPRKWLRE